MFCVWCDRIVIGGDFIRVGGKPIHCACCDEYNAEMDSAFPLEDSWADDESDYADYFGEECFA